jgi:hypothetical protein
MKKVLIATPALDQKVDCYFTNSLCQSIRLGLKNDIDINCVMLANESILPMARNELMYLAYTEEYDDVVFIDADELWEPQGLIDIIQSPKDVVCLPVVNKTDRKEEYNIWFKPDSKMDSDGYISLDKTGAGFLKLSKKAIIDLYESNPHLHFRNKVLSLIFNYEQDAESFIGEDITVSNKLKELGYDIWMNPKYTVYHIGNKMYTGNFAKLFNL